MRLKTVFCAAHDSRLLSFILSFLLLLCFFSSLFPPLGNRSGTYILGSSTCCTTHIVKFNGSPKRLQSTKLLIYIIVG